MRHLIETLNQRLVVYKDTLSNVEQDSQKAHERVRELVKQKASIEEDMANANRQVDGAQVKLATLAGELRKRVQAITELKALQFTCEYFRGMVLLSLMHIHLSNAMHAVG